MATPMADPSALHDSTGSYVLNSLDTAELVEFEAHLATCPRCRDEVALFCETTAELSLLSMAAAPPGLRGDILTAIRTPAPRWTVFESKKRDQGEDPPVDEVGLRRQWRATLLGGLVAAMLALALGLGGVVHSLVQERYAQVTQVTVERQLSEAPDATTVTESLVGGGQVTFIASKRLNRAMFIGTGLPNPGRNNRYQLWTATGEPTPGGMTGVFRDKQITGTGSDVRILFSGNIAGADFLAVNVEPVGSTPNAPTNPVLAAGEI